MKSVVEFMCEASRDPAGRLKLLYGGLSATRDRLREGKIVSPGPDAFNVIPPTPSPESLELADGGDPDAQCRVARIYDERREYQEALKWLRRAARLGRLEAWNCIGCFYLEGRGVRKDHRRALWWFRRAAKRGEAIAQLNLGQCYHFGWGVEVDMMKAYEWTRAAAEQGQSDAMHNLGRCYLYGFGVERDAALAYAWLMLACFVTSRPAAKYIESAIQVRDTLSPAEVATAETVARAWKPKAAKVAVRRIGPKYQLGSQEIMGSVCFWHVEYAIQRTSDGRWILYFDGEADWHYASDPEDASGLASEFEEREYDVSEFVLDLRNTHVEQLASLADEIEAVVE